MTERVTSTKSPDSKSQNPVTSTQNTGFSQSHATTPVVHILHLQRTIGNQAVQRMFQSGIIQTKLRIGKPKDMYEQEADRVADQVMRMPVTDANQIPEIEEQIKTPDIQRTCAECEEEDEKLIQAKTDGDVTPKVTPARSYGIQSLQGGGRLLSESERSFFEPRFGENFSDVRVHNDEKAASLARSVNALAFTHGNDIYFNKGKYNPNSNQGKQLLAHELSHTIQQKGMVQKKIQKYPEYSCDDGDVITRAQTVVWFEHNSTRFRSDSRVDSNIHFLLLLREIGSYLSLTNNTGIVKIHGYASQEGSDSHNVTLSLQRALRIKELLEVAGIPATNMIAIPHGESRSYRNLANNRRVEVTYTPSVTCMGFPPMPITGSPCAFTCSTPHLLGARTPHYGAGDDFRFFDFPSLSVSQWLRVAPFRPMWDGLLEFGMNNVLGTLAGSDGRDMVSHFRGGTGSTWTHGIGSRLSRDATTCPSVNKALRNVRTQLAAQMRTMISSGTINCSGFSLSPVPTFHFTSGDSIALKAIMGGTQGLEMYITGMRIQDPATCSYELDIQFVVFDDFGVDTDDLYWPALIKFWILQHERRGNRPFINRLLINRMITL